MSQDEQTKALINSLIQRHESLKGDTHHWKEHWSDIACFVMPEKDDIYYQNKYNNGQKDQSRLFDHTAILANEKLASALHGMLTNPTLDWFGFTSEIPEIDKRDDARKFFAKSSDVIHSTLNGSNFQEQIHQIYLDLGGFGTGWIAIEEDDETVVNFQTSPIFESTIDENSRGRIDTCFREYKWSYRKVLQKFGTDWIKDDYEKEQINKRLNEEVTILHAVYKNEKFNPAIKNFTEKAFDSIFILKDDETLLAKEGFNEFPFAIPRWSKISSEKYGRSPSMTALTTIKYLNQVRKNHMIALQKTVNPPLAVSDKGLMSPLKTRPGAINYVRKGLDASKMVDPLFTGANPSASYQEIDNLIFMIREAFFLNELQLREGPQMTATEVLRRTEEQVRIMAPILGRLHNELLKPIIDRVFAILLRKNKLPEIPEILKGRDIKITYSSMIARSQRVAEIDNLTRAVGTAAPIIQMDSNVIDYLDTDETFKLILKTMTTNVDIIRDENDVAEIRESRAEALQAQQEAGENLTEAETANKVAGAVSQIQ